MTEREFWIAVRAALLMFVDAIERRYCVGKFAPSKVLPIQPSDSIMMPEGSVGHG